MTFPPLLRALNSRNYRVFFAGQGVSLVGNWMCNTASAWLAYDFTHSAWAVGVLTFANQIPILLFGPLGGVLGDRLDRRRLLQVLQCLCLLLSGSMAALVALDLATFPLLLTMALLRGMVNAVEFPSRQSFVVALVDDKKDLPNAIAMNSSLFNVARLIGPGLAGALIAFAGPAWCFGLDAASFVAAIFALGLVRVPERAASTARPRNAFGDLAEGLRHVRHSPNLLAPLSIVPVIAFSGFVATILAPVFAVEVFGGDARSLGSILSALGAGALCSALLLGSRSSVQGLERWVWQGAVLTALSLVGFAFSPSVGVATFFLVANGMGVVLCMAGANTLLQARVGDAMRGRVMGLFVMGQGMYPLGSLAAGALASSLGLRATVCAFAALAFASGLFLRRGFARAAGSCAPSAASTPQG